MANFTYLPTRGSLASWVTGTPVSGAEFWFFESSIVKCPNFTDGGTYAPSNPIIIGGSGIKVTGLTWCTGYTRLDGNVDIGLGSSQNLVVSAVSTFVGNATHTGNLTCSAASNFNANGYAGLNGDTDIGNSSSNYCNISATTQINAPLTVSGATQLNGDITAPIKLGTGGYLKRRRARLTSGATQYATLQYTDHVTLKVSCTLTLESYGDTGAEMHVTNLSTGSVTVANDSAATLITLAAKAWCVLTRETGLGDGWEVTKYGTVP